MDLTQFDGHTPGPWQCILNNPLAHGDVVTSEGEVVARIRGWGWLQKLPDGAAQQDANGRLVAASPELLAEVRRLTAEADALRRWKSTNAPRLDALEGLLHAAQAKAAAGHETIATLDSERAANSMLTGEVERLRDALQRERDELVSRNDRLVAERTRIIAEAHDNKLRARRLETERDALAARLAEIEAQQPVGVVEAGEWRTGFGDTYPAVWVKITQDGAGVSVPLGTVLHASPAPAAAPERAEPVQGPVRLTDEQIAQITAQTWGSVDIAPQSAAAFARAIEAWMLHAHQGTAAEPERAEPAANELPTRCTECGQLGWHKFGCSHVAHERGLRVMAQSGDSTSCPRGER